MKTKEEIDVIVKQIENGEITSNDATELLFDGYFGETEAERVIIKKSIEALEIIENLSKQKTDEKN